MINVIALTKDQYQTLVVQPDQVTGPNYQTNTITINSVTPSGLTITADGGVLHITGDEVQTYQAPVTYHTDRGDLLILITINVCSSGEKEEPLQVQPLMDTIKVGDTAMGVGIFVTPQEIDISRGSATWEIINHEGLILNSGPAYNATVQQTMAGNMVRASCLVSVPSNTEPTPYGERYQVRYTLVVPQDSQQVYKQVASENITVTGFTTVEIGTQNSVELEGSTAKPLIVTERMYQYMNMSIYRDNQLLLGPIDVTNPTIVDNGYVWQHSVKIPNGHASLSPLSIVWNYGNNGPSGESYTEHAKLIIVNPTILDAMDDVQARINKARAILFGGPEMLFPPEVVMVWLRRGADYFNGAFGQFTNFTFTNAKGIIREFWLTAAEMMALESQELAEGEKAFNYSGANISLDVDRAQAYGAASDKLRARLDTELRPVKENLIIKGQIAGDGSNDPTQSINGAIGSVGTTITPASTWGIIPYYGARLR